MRIVQVIQSVSNPSAGPTYSVARLADELCRSGAQCSVSSIGAPPASWPYAAPLTRYDGWLERRAGIALQQWLDLRRAATTPCVLHSHGVWRAANVFPLWLPNGCAARLVVSPRGMLSEWSLQHKRWRKLPFWLAMQAPALARTSLFHATARSEYADIRKAGFRQPVAIIPNGVEIPPLPAAPKRRRVVFLSRIDPKKGLDLLLPAWTRLAVEFPDWDLVIAGPLNSDYADSMQKLARDLQTPRVTFVGEVTGSAKHTLLATAALFVLPTYSENFGIAVAEALAHGTPVVTTTETPWADLPTREAGWYVRPERTAVEAALRAGMGLSLAELAQRGQRGRAWMAADYGWAQIGQQMVATYEWLLYGAKQPDCVVTD